MPTARNLSDDPAFRSARAADAALALRDLPVDHPRRRKHRQIMDALRREKTLADAIEAVGVLTDEQRHQLALVALQRDTHGRRSVS